MSNIWCEIVCHRCNDTTSGQYTNKNIPRQGMSKNARNNGWITIGNQWFCPQCKGISND